MCYTSYNIKFSIHKKTDFVGGEDEGHTFEISAPTSTTLEWTQYSSASATQTNTLNIQDTIDYTPGTGSY